MNNLAIIPARSGSKGLKDKNIKLLSGKPLLQYSVEAAISSSVFACVHVSTDSLRYAEVARECGADVPFLRCTELSEDTSDTWSTVRFVLEKYKHLGYIFDMVTILQPTSPLRGAEDIKHAYKMFCDKDARTIISVSEASQSPLLMNTLDESLSLEGFIDIGEVGRRQEMPIYYRVNGAIYMLKPDVLNRISDLYGKGSYAYIMPSERAIDIDDIMDFAIAEFLMHYNVNSTDGK